MDRKIRVGAVSYLNTKPLIYGLENGQMTKTVELVSDYPAKVAAMLLNNDIDVGLVPVAIIPKLTTAHIITDYCIGCVGPVASVCLFSEVPIEQIKTVLLDYQSRTSVRLAKILLKEYWKINPVLVDGKEDVGSQINGAVAAVVIGDRALQQRSQCAYIYDLGEAWIQHTALPFVFAAWVSNKELVNGFVDEFSAANATGLHNLDKVVASINAPYFDIMQYYTRHISYNLEEKKLQGLQLFLDKIKEHKL